MGSIPKTLQGVLWSVDVGKLDLERDKVYVIHQVLSCGALSDIKWLFSVYKPETIRRIFLGYPQKVYTKPAFKFAENALLNLGDSDMNEEEYVQAFY